MPTRNDDLAEIIARFADRITADFAALADKVQSWQRRQVDLESYDIETRKRQERDRAQLDKLRTTVTLHGLLLWLILVACIIGMVALLLLLLT